MVHQAQSSDELKAMAKEMSQIQGTPVLQVMRMGTTTDGKPLRGGKRGSAAAAECGAESGPCSDQQPPIRWFRTQQEATGAAPPDASSTQGGEANHNRQSLLSRPPSWGTLLTMSILL